MKEQLFSEAELNMLNMLAIHKIEATNWASFTVLIDQLLSLHEETLVCKYLQLYAVVLLQAYQQQSVH